MATALITASTGTLPSADDTYTGVVDSFMDRESPTANHISETENSTRIQTSAGTYEQIGIIKFTGLSNITGPVTVSAVELGLACYIATNGTANHTLRKVLRDWTAAVTWNTYDGSTGWTAGGALGAGDSESTPSYTGTDWDTTTGSYVAIPGSAGMIADVEDWINNGSNFGWIMRGSWNGSDHRRIWYSNEGTATLRPYLLVTFTAGGGGGGLFAGSLGLVGVGR